MSYELGKIIGVCCGTVFGIILVAVILKFSKKDGRIKCEYDEMQTRIRGNSFKYAFYTAIVGNGLNCLIKIADVRLPMDEAVTSFIIICVAVLVQCIYSINKGVYFAMNESPVKVLVCFGLLTVVNIVIGISALRSGQAVTNGQLNYMCVNLICGIFFIIIIITLLFNKFVIRKNDSEEE